MTTLSRSRGCGNCGAPALNRREMLWRSGMGFGTLALACLLRQEGLLSAGEAKGPVPLRGNGKVKSVILLYMGVGVSHVDSWDPKPDLQKLQGKDVPQSIGKNVPMHMRLRLKNLYPSPFAVKQYGRSGTPV